MADRPWHILRSVLAPSSIFVLGGCARAAAEQSDKSSIGIELVRLVPSLIWPVVLLIILAWKRDEITRLFKSLTKRVESGAAIKLSGVLEVGSSAPSGKFVCNVPSGSFAKDPSRELDRNQIYTDSKGPMIAHTLHPSEMEDQVYDILLYLVTTKGSFLDVKEVQYYFGKHWDHLVATSRTKLNGFAVKVSAYGPFLCTARIVFNDGSQSPQYRYVDFEAPALQPLITADGQNAAISAEPPFPEGSAVFSH